MKNMFKKLFFLVLLLALFFPMVTMGADEVGPEENPLCWREEDCRQARMQFLREGAVDQRGRDNGWIRGDRPCDSSGWGKCLPAGVAETQIAFGGQRRFLHIGEFIQVIYNYALRVVAIVAVVMIVVAGIQWTTSGGSSEAITSAKKRIGGALIGLVLAYLSYTILYNINPSLVNLRLPQVWLLRQVSLIRFVSQLPDGVKLIQTADVNGKPVPAATPVEKRENNMRTFWCGKQFRKEQSDNRIYIGDYCEPSGNICVQQSNKPPFACIEGTVYGEITSSGNDNWAFPWTDEGETELWAICSNGSTYDVSENSHTFDLPDYKQSYIVKANADRGVRDCGGESQVKGFALMFEMNESDDPIDEEHLIGNGGVDLGDEEILDQPALTSINAERLIPLSQIRSGGLRIDIDIVGVRDID